MSDSRRISDQKTELKTAEISSIQQLSNLMKKAHIPGLSIATLSHGKIVESTVIGITDMESKNPVTTDTIFWACSLSKPVFAYLVIQLIQSGKLGKDFTLDTPLYQIFDDPKRFNNDERRTLITVRMVLSHQTGMPNENKLDDKFDPGNIFRYSGEGYIYLQKVIEKYTKFSLEELAKKEIFLPLGMKHSSFSLPQPELIAAPHDEIMYPKIPLRLCPGNNNHPAASLHTTASDYALFLEACLKNEAFIEIALKTSQISTEKDKEAIEKKVETDSLKSIHWGLGFALQISTQTGMPELAFHWGHGPGARGFFAINLDSRSAVVYFANSENGLTIAEDVATPIVGNIKPAIDYLFKKYDYQHYPQLEKRYQSLTSDKKNIPAPNNRLKWFDDLKKYKENPILIEKDTLKEYLGVYGPLEIKLQNNSLNMIFLNNDLHELIPLSETLFASKNDITFRLEFDKEKHEVTSHFLNPDWGPITDIRNVLGFLDDQTIENTMIKAKIPSISIAHIDNNGTITTKVKDVSDQEVKVKTTPDTLFGAASLSKPVFSYLVLKLIRDNKTGEVKDRPGEFKWLTQTREFNLDTPIHEIYPDIFKKFQKEDEEKVKKLTAKKILSHTTGLPIVHNSSQGLIQFQFEPGTKYGYSGPGIAYLQEIIEALTGVDLETLAKQHIFDKNALDMPNSSFHYNKDIPLQAANSLYTTASDYVKFLKGWMNDDTLNDAFKPTMMEESKKILTMQHLHQPQDWPIKDVALSNRDIEHVSWGLGLGLQIDEDGDPISAYHSGDMGEWRAWAAINLKEKTAIVYFANSHNGHILAEQIIPPFVKLDHVFNFFFNMYGFAKNIDEMAKENSIEFDNGLRDSCLSLKKDFYMSQVEGELQKSQMKIAESSLTGLDLVREIIPSIADALYFPEGNINLIQFGSMEAKRIPLTSTAQFTVSTGGPSESSNPSISSQLALHKDQKEMQTPRTEESKEIKAVENNLTPPMIVASSNKSMNLNQRMKELQVPGVSIAIINDGKIETKQYGDIHTPETKLQAGSISKVITAVVALQLVQDKKIELDEDVNEIFKKYSSDFRIPYNDKYNKHEKVTLRRLLSHTAGLSVSSFDKGYASDSKSEDIPTLDQILKGEKPANSPAVKPIKIPGGDWQYSGGGTQMIQKIIEVIEGISFSDSCQIRIFKPSGMDSSTFSLLRPQDKESFQVSKGHLQNGETLPGGWKLFPESAAAGLWTTPTDLARFVIGIQNNIFLSKELTAVTFKKNPKSEYGLGFKVNSSGSEFFHGGSTHGYLSYLVGFTSGQGAIIMTNSFNGQSLIDEMIPAIAKIFDWPQNYQGAPQIKIPAAINIPICKKYVGEFEVKGKGDFIKIFFLGDKLCISSSSKALKNYFITKNGGDNKEDVPYFELTPAPGNKVFFNAEKNFEITFINENTFSMWGLVVQKPSFLRMQAGYQREESKQDELSTPINKNPPLPTNQLKKSEEDDAPRKQIELDPLPSENEEIVKTKGIKNP
jgi:CubicO group peptidase (beta-lactamase class C family)